MYGIIAISLVVLTGWAGQISLGQFAFVGIGAAVTSALLVHAGADLLLALLASALAGAAAAALVGIPALRIQGLLLAIATLSFAVFTAVVFGGLGSLPGALLGAVYIESTQYFLTGSGRLLATGGGLLVILMVIPGGLGELLYAGRDRLLRLLAARKGLSVPS